MANCELDRALAPKRRHLCLATLRACGRCGKERLIAATHMPQGDASIREILSRMHHDGCGGRRERRNYHRRRGRQQPADAADRAAGGVTASRCR